MSGSKLVLGNYEEEMQRRRELGKGNDRKDAVATLLALGLIAWGVSPLGLWHTVVALGGLYWVLITTTQPAYRVADELDLLERKIVARFSELSQPSQRGPG